MPLDKRLNAYRDDLADARLKGVVDAPRYTEGAPMMISEPVVRCLRRPELSAPLDTEFLFAERVRVFDTAGGYAWVQCETDGYVGYVPDAGIGTRLADPTHRVSVPLALVYAAPSIKVPVLTRLPLSSALTLGPEENVGGERFHAGHGGYILAQHVTPIGVAQADFVAVAERFVGTPYLFGGRSWLGIDCSALIQVALHMCGRNIPRDSDMQEGEVGEPLPVGTSELRRGDLIFWKGHVGVMQDGVRLLHANGHHMCCASEPLAEALKRLSGMGLQPTAMRRLLS